MIPRNKRERIINCPIGYENISNTCWDNCPNESEKDINNPIQCKYKNIKQVADNTYKTEKCNTGFNLIGNNCYGNCTSGQIVGDKCKITQSANLLGDKLLCGNKKSIILENKKCKEYISLNKSCPTGFRFEELYNTDIDISEGYCVNANSNINLENIYNNSFISKSLYYLNPTYHDATAIRDLCRVTRPSTLNSTTTFEKNSEWMPYDNTIPTISRCKQTFSGDGRYTCPIGYSLARETTSAIPSCFPDELFIQKTSSSCLTDYVEGISNGKCLPKQYFNTNAITGNKKLQDSKLCPTYSVFNNINNNCERDMDYFCPTGYKFNSTKEHCYKICQDSEVYFSKKESNITKEYCVPKTYLSTNNFEINTNVSCPNGSELDLETKNKCIKNYCPTGYLDINGICYQKCPTDYVNEGSNCTKSVNRPIDNTQKIQSCNQPYQISNDGNCYPVCPTNYFPDGNGNCVRGIPNTFSRSGISTTETCPQNHDLLGAFCFERCNNLSVNNGRYIENSEFCLLQCDPGFGPTNGNPSQCQKSCAAINPQPANGRFYNKPNSLTECDISCNPGFKLEDGICIKDCSLLNNSIRNGVFVNNPENKSECLINCNDSFIKNENGFCVKDCRNITPLLNRIVKLNSTEDECIQVCKNGFVEKNGVCVKNCGQDEPEFIGGNWILDPSNPNKDNCIRDCVTPPESKYNQERNRCEQDCTTKEPFPNGQWTMDRNGFCEFNCNRGYQKTPGNICVIDCGDTTIFPPPDNNSYMRRDSTTNTCVVDCKNSFIKNSEGKCVKDCVSFNGAIVNGYYDTTNNICSPRCNNPNFTFDPVAKLCRENCANLSTVTNGSWVNNYTTGNCEKKCNPEFELFNNNCLPDCLNIPNGITQRNQISGVCETICNDGFEKDGDSIFCYPRCNPVQNGSVSRVNKKCQTVCNPGFDLVINGSSTQCLPQTNNYLTNGSNLGSASGSSTGSTSGSNLGSTTGSPTGSPTGSNLGSTTGSPTGSNLGSTSGSTGSSSGSNTGSTTGSSSGSNTGSTNGSFNGLDLQTDLSGNNLEEEEEEEEEAEEKEEETFIKKYWYILLIPLIIIILIIIYFLIIRKKNIE